MIEIRMVSREMAWNAEGVTTKEMNMKKDGERERERERWISI